MFEVISQGFFSEVGGPVYGNQDVGITPGGAMDLFSLQTGNILLGQDLDAKALEMIVPPVLKFKENAYCVLTGAPCKNSVLKSKDGTSEFVNHTQVFFVKEGDELTIGSREYGFRVYLCMKATKDSKPSDKMMKRSRGEFNTCFSWKDADGAIRVIEGPEFKNLNDQKLFLDNYWVITPDTSTMGMRISSDYAVLKVNIENMISEAVSNGTVQLTPKGPIILLKHRQTVGGYPRIFNVISSDVDLLGQYMPGQILKFKKVSIEEAIKISELKQKELNSLKEKFKYI